MTVFDYDWNICWKVDVVNLLKYLSVNLPPGKQNYALVGHQKMVGNDGCVRFLAGMVQVSQHEGVPFLFDYVVKGQSKCSHSMGALQHQRILRQLLQTAV